ncbi:uroporphyrin-III C-methyltransferase / precorrin-2 dehydrogenase / sirohydrochlorin ferrochelatase [Promicromonospora umidemergens]|uniref:uroporphyrinogen-III C-methyltransferase n=1 Tax=Promicromonospora umidemergens TaxID=629679 RepID=A0ABP8Y4C0_9MICO|nr:uroporphyrinogen-III C-methyltransferase [Promicromonospora umidemergens]MCP2282591.1 uroporphyrin-III C-methyltransferase / precorrin-2 dehydrogenase / sirohydrochlorin ferrochelatase [Promicromonospora umidemergens]
MSDIYPLGLKVTGRLVVVVGGGPVAARRVRSLVEARARVRLVAPHSVLAESGMPVASETPEPTDGPGPAEVEWVRRDYRAGDLDGAWLVHTATGSAAVDRQVSDDAERARVFCVTAGDASVGSAWVPAVARTTLTDDAEVTVSVTAGRDPRRARAVRDAVAAQLQSGRLPLRRHRPKLPDGGLGRVWLVGGGPGDTGLITARGRSVLAQADVVIVDRLGPRALLDELSPDVEIVDVGKTSGNHPVPQHEINALLIQHAQAGSDVVRLKGGDPYVLGRGGEELSACRAAGIEVEVVPGVTSAVSVPAAAGIPVTHRGVARGFSVLTGHDGAAEVPGGADHTLVLLMGVTRLADTAEALVTADRPADTPAAVIEDGYGPGQRVTVGTLATIADRAAEVGVKPPAVIVVGAVVRLSPAWPHQAR